MQEKKADELNAFAHEYPNHTFVSFLSSVRVDLSAQMTEPKVHTLICSGKAPTEVHRFENFELDEDENELNVGVYV